LAGFVGACRIFAAVALIVTKMSITSRLIFYAVLALCCLSTAVAQTKEIYVYTAEEGQSSGVLVGILHDRFDGTVVAGQEFPDRLDYVAIMLFGPWTPGEQGWLDSTQQAFLIEYATRGGMIYIEAGGFRKRKTHWEDDTTDNQFWDLVGNVAEGRTAMVVRVDSIYGVPGTFAEGVTGSIPYDPMRQDASYGFGLDPMPSVIVAVGAESLAWQSQRSDIKVVLHRPLRYEHYPAFIERVICNYFQICILDVADELPEKLTISFDPVRSELNLPAAGSIVISDILGREVLRREVGARYMLPEDLAKGIYIVTWASSEERASITISVQ
jgi:hypothetical protein